jgi:hypothetical protein
MLSFGVMLLDLFHRRSSAASRCSRGRNVDVSEKICRTNDHLCRCVHRGFSWRTSCHLSLLTSSRCDSIGAQIAPHLSGIRIAFCKGVSCAVAGWASKRLHTGPSVREAEVAAFQMHTYSSDRDQKNHCKIRTSNSELSNQYQTCEGIISCCNLAW